MVPYLFRISVCFGLAGMVLGIAMGVRQDFTLVPAHAHVNLVGFVTMFLAALYYRTTPGVAETLLARIQAVASVVGAVIFPIGIAAVLIGGKSYEPLAIAGSMIVLTAMALFAVIVFQTSGLEARPVSRDNRHPLRFENTH